MNRDIISYAVILLAGLFFMAMTIGMPRTEVTLVDSVLFPRIVLGLIIIMSAVGLYSAFKACDGAAIEPIHRALFIMLALVLAFIIALGVIGFVASTSIFITVFSLYMMGSFQPRHIAGLGLAGFAIAWCINYIFIEILSFILP